MKPLKLLLLLILLAVAPRSWALGPEDLLLVVNKNVPAGQKLAEFYRTARLVPEGRIVALDLPPGDDIPFAMYEKNVVRPLREHIQAAGLADKVKCIVTFYGVPLRIGPRLATEQEKQEIAELTKDKQELYAKLAGVVSDLELKAKEADSSFAPGQGADLRQLVARAEVAIKLLGQAIGTAKEKDRPARMVELGTAMRLLTGPAGAVRAMSAAALASATQPAREQAEQLVRGVQQLAGQIAELQPQRDDPAARAKMRSLVAAGFGLIEHLRIVEGHLAYLDAPESTAAFDSELAMLWWDLYPRGRWQGNPLYYASSAPPAQRMVMVSRLDAPQAGQVREMILASLRAERDGLKGKVVLDARGLKAANPEKLTIGSYEWYDASIVDLAGLIRGKTKLPMLHDVSPTVLPAGSADGVALYCGWYSVRNYVPACRFAVGAVAFHVASFELVNLRNPNEKGWVRGLLNDGAVASIGPVAEPYLMAFPRADDFFPLLMTGQVTLAEAYWRTQPTVSWMMALIGDPLYRPYAKEPALKVEELPERLGKIVGSKQ